MNKLRRVYGRTRDTLTGEKTWRVVTTDDQGYDDMVYLTNMAQVVKLNLGESPFYADWGIAAHQSVVSQIYPDYYIALIQQRFSPLFASLMLEKMPNAIDETGRPAPFYAFRVVTHAGSYLAIDVPI